MNELDILQSLRRLKFQSLTSLLLMLVGAGVLGFSVYYSASRLTPLEASIASKQEELAALKAEEAIQLAKLKELQANLDVLKASTEALYAVRITPTNKVYEVKATALATGRMLTPGPEYKFSLLINSPQETLDEIRQVTYRMDHPTFPQRDYVSIDRTSQFATSYVGWGCLTRVKVSVTLISGVVQDFDFNMCRSLGKEWG